MNVDSYKILKLSNGEMIICELNNHANNSYEILNPLKMEVIARMTPKGPAETLNLTPWLQHFSDQKYFNIEKEQIILQANASIGLSKYYEYIMHRIDDSWEHGNNLVPEGLEEIDDEDVYDELLSELEAENDTVH